ncbi:MAG TPA: SRPBCC domain-containing protein [Ktedonobacteraceae bacterium]|nr:SRPBCC domain-containing protein [Ktedonobacteraceae bacterium]
MQEATHGLIIEASSTINAPVEKVWSILIDFARYAEWNTFVPSMQTTLQVGSPLTMGVRMRKRLFIKIRATVSAVEFQHRLAWVPKMPAWFLKSERLQVITALDAGTTRYWTCEVFTGMASPLLRLLLRKDLQLGFASVAQDLKARAETMAHVEL